MPLTAGALAARTELAAPAPGARRQPRVSAATARALLAALLVAGIYALRLAAGTAPGNGVSLLLVLPVAILAVDRGVWAGVLAGLAAYGVFALWTGTGQIVDVDTGGHLIRGGVYVLVGLATGWSSEHLRASEARQRQIADSLGDMVSVHDPEGRYVYVSSAAHALLGYSPRELIGTSAYEHFHPHDAAAVRRAHDELLSDPAGLGTVVYRVRRADGHHIWFETVSRTIHEGDRLVEILCSSRDVTARETGRLARDEDRAGLQVQIQRVLDERAVDIVIQPILELASGTITGYEALSRFPSVAARPPSVWFEHAAHVGLSEPLELLSIERALELFAALPADATLSVNASPQTLISPRLLEILRDVPADRVIVELTEHAAIGDYRGFNAAIRELREHGVRLAVDDAGAGFASLRHILDLGPEIIKLDMSLTRHIHRDAARRALASALCDFAANLGADVVAEGIEEQAELDELLRLGIRFGQGYLLGRPAPNPVRAA